ncbi:hypothetical protein MSAN_00607800 [Mycena sanguinolenta]|uniref:Uncharacterized protein n=1 Tax=Mycena sanguinolenta TaxID=230812 RepID=A0A8H6Z7H1_9AGAR|nr:hypothetical protein MSAN_00607800 [Mycena sanguinolenta]
MSKFNGEAGAGLVFLILYLCVFLWLLFAYSTHIIKWRSRWSMLFFHVVVRLASQACGIGFAVLGFANTNMFLAFLILGAEGYFTLVLCAFRFIISWHEHNLPGGVSWLEPRRDTKIDPRKRTQRILAFLFLGPFALLIYHDNLMAAFHLLLILANTAIIIGGSYLANANLADFDSSDTQRRLRISRISRTAGQSVFLGCNAALLFVLLLTARNDRRTRGRVHPTLVVLLIAWIPLIVRGTYGVLQSADFELSYYNPNNYGSNGFTAHYTLVEYLMGVTTEWLACVLLSCTYFTSKNDPPKPDITPQREEKVVELEQKT